MTPTDGKTGAVPPPPVIEKEISSLRDEIGDLVGELDRRRKEAFDVRLQLQRHPVAVAVGAAAVLLVLGSAIAVLSHESNERQRRTYKVRQLRKAFGRMIEKPDRVARGEPPPSEKILAAVGTAAATYLVKRALEKSVPKPSQVAQAKAAPASRNGKHAS